MLRIGVLSKDQQKLDYVLGLTTKQFLDRRLQTIVFSKSKYATSIHQARTLIFQKKIAINRANRRQIVTIPSYIVRSKNEQHITKIVEENEKSRTKKRTIRKREEKAQNQAGDDE
jgi:small subunit ribosomal protein S9e